MLATAAAAAGSGHQGAWVNLIQRNSAPLLRGWTHPGLPAGWTVHDGVLPKGGPVDDLVSTRTYRDFDLELEWNIGKEGNSGIFYRATHQYDEVYWTGPEYQLLDDQNADDGKQRITAAGSVYAMYPAPAGLVHPYGHWNKARIVVRGSHVTYWMNGQQDRRLRPGQPGLEEAGGRLEVFGLSRIWRGARGTDRDPGQSSGRRQDPQHADQSTAMSAVQFTRPGRCRPRTAPRRTPAIALPMPTARAGVDTPHP